MKHTPGPWTTRRWNDDQQVVEVNDSTGWKKDYPGCYIAQVGGWGYSGVANSYLIAAAPDMLEALVNLYEVALANELEDSYKIFMSDARDAIAKARGESIE